MICESRKFFIRLRSIFLTIFLLLSLTYRNVAYASAPTEHDYGCFVGSVKISKADLPYVEDNVQTLPYNGKSQVIDIIKEKYENKGIIYYKIGENGEWHEGIPSFRDVGDYDLYYYVEGDSNHNNLRSKENPLKMDVSIFVPKDDWGTEVNNSGYTNYVTSDGKTSAEIDNYGVIWLKEESDGTSAWYGVDNTSRTFALGSRFWTKWLSPEKNTEEYQKYFEQLDDESKTKAEEGKLWIFETGVTSPDGVEYTNLDISVPYYIQLGEDWDNEDVSAYYISSEKDERLNPEIGDASYFNSRSEMVFPKSSEYAKLRLKHFSPYVVLDTKDDFKELDVNDIKLKYTETNQNIDKFNSLYEKGTVYYKVGKNGKWTQGIPSFKDVGDYDLYYYVKGNDEYNDLGSIDNPILVKVSVEDWGTRVNNDGYINYVTPDGKTSAEIDKYGVIWLKEESDGTHAWYGVDNTSKTFALGSRFWVKWLSAERDKEEYKKYFEQLDDEHKKRAETDKLWIFITGVTSPDGVEYTNLDVPIPYYIQLGNDWDENEINAIFISQNVDEIVDVAFGDVSFFDSRFDNISFPETNGRYARLLLKHFSPYAIYDEVNTIYEGLDNNKITDNKVQGDNKVTNCDKSYCNKNTGDDAYIIRYMITIFVVSLTISVILFLELINRKKKTSRIGVLLRSISSAYKVYNLTSYDYNRISNSNHLGRRKLNSKCKFVNFKVYFDKNTINLLGIVSSILKTSSDIHCFINGGYRLNMVS